jgi:ABC-type lipoprotein release transport system permease subunit
MVAILIASISAFAILAWDKATGLNAEEKKEIGILKALGWDISDVLKLRFWEGLVISFLSFLTGVIAALVHVFIFGAVMFLPVLMGWSVLFPKLTLRPHVNYYQLAIVLILTVIPYTVATIIPCWKAAITEPDAVMRE